MRPWTFSEVKNNELIDNFRAKHDPERSLRTVGLPCGQEDEEEEKVGATEKPQETHRETHRATRGASRGAPVDPQSHSRAREVGTGAPQSHSSPEDGRHNSWKGPLNWAVSQWI